jgi:hypothetical protein
MERDEFYAKARRFAAARVGVRRVNAGPEERFREVFRPTLAGEFVSPKGMPLYGYATRPEAAEGGRRFRDACRTAATDPKSFERVSIQ